MYKFTVLALSDAASEAGIEISFQAFADFHHALTPKHKKNSKLIFIDKGGYALEALQRAEQFEIKPFVQVLNWKRLDHIQKAYESASLLLLPSRSKTKALIVNALSSGIPILSYREAEQEEFVDQTCGTLIDYYSDSQSIEDFANVMRILYYDPDACKLLKKGAFSKYENQINLEQTAKKQMTTAAAS